RRKKIVSAKFLMSQSNAPTTSAFTDNRLIDAMIYHFSLQMAALFAGAILCLLGAFGFATESSTRDILAAFPRSRGAGIALLSIGLVWVMVPYKLRDQIGWFSKTTARWRGVTAFAFAYGATLIALAFLSY